MQITVASDAPAREDDGGSLRGGGTINKTLLVGREGSVNYYKVTLGHTLGEYRSPRHRHNFDQIVLSLDGDYTYANGCDLPKGWVGYFPELVHYGPLLRKSGCLQLLIPFVGASGALYVGAAQRKAAIAELNRRGTFAGGSFSYVDATGNRHNRDGYEALWETVTGRAMEYAAPRYGDVIAMNPANYEWVARTDAPGVAMKWLGSFTERGLRVAMIRLDAGATMKTELHAAPQILFLVSGEIECADRVYPAHTAIGLESMEGPVNIKAVAASELFCLRLPVFATAASRSGDAAPAR